MAKKDAAYAHAQSMAKSLESQGRVTRIKKDETNTVSASLKDPEALMFKFAKRDPIVCENLEGDHAPGTVITYR
jgi:threonine aldolase